MGYYSEVVVCMRTKDYKALPTFLMLKGGKDADRGWLLRSLEEGIIHQGKMKFRSPWNKESFTVVRIPEVKWYLDFDGVKTFMEYLDGLDYYYFYRQGENPEDYEEKTGEEAEAYLAWQKAEIEVDDFLFGEKEGEKNE